MPMVPMPAPFDEQEWVVELRDATRAMLTLPDSQRDALRYKRESPYPHTSCFYHEELQCWFLEGKVQGRVFAVSWTHDETKWLQLAKKLSRRCAKAMRQSAT